MGFLLLFLVFALLTCAITFLVSDSGKIGNTISAFIIWFLVASFFMCVSWGFSYTSYLGLKKRSVTVEQYRSAIQMYGDRGVLDFKEGGHLFSAQSELTDLKYYKYQEILARMIKDLRDVVVTYNSRLVGKRTMKANWFWNWCIIGPDPDMKIMRLE